MKTFSLCILAAVFVCLRAAPAWYDLLPATNLKKGGFGAIWNDCSEKDDPIKLSKVEISPKQPKLGDNVTISYTALLEKTITGGQADFFVKYGVVPILSQTLNLCDVMKRFGLPCPVRSGTYQNFGSMVIPKNLPKGHYSGYGKMFDHSGNELLCVGFDVEL